MRSLFLAFIVALPSLAFGSESEQASLSYARFLAGETLTIREGASTKTYTFDPSQVVVVGDSLEGYNRLSSILRTEIFGCREEAAVIHRHDMARSYSSACLRDAEAIRAAISSGRTPDIYGLYRFVNANGELIPDIILPWIQAKLTPNASVGELSTAASDLGFEVTEQSLIPRTYELGVIPGNIEDPLRAVDALSSMPFIETAYPMRLGLDGPIPVPSIGVHN